MPSATSSGTVLPLRDLQLRMQRAIMRDEPSVASGLLSPGPAGSPSSAERLSIYRGNWRVGYARALAAGFPVIARLVGEACFDQLAGACLDQHPSTSGDLNESSRHFPSFLAGRYAATEFCYLADVARLEHLYASLDSAPDADPISLERLQSMVVDGTDLRFRLHPRTGLLESAYPVSRIWITNQPDATAETIDLDSGAEQLLVRAHGGGLELHRLRPAEFALLAGLASGATIVDALAEALEGSPAADPARTLHRVFAAGALIS